MWYIYKSIFNLRINKDPTSFSHALKGIDLVN